ncbi:hypothetical protein WAF17_03200 [Bernardetia sp. ABR2-2B]|uniref:hypothetical protein n=1 Tax=Bernardetia sp. ABR2-2B TaxID=3127472 RepID=UPI0030D33BAE
MNKGLLLTENQTHFLEENRQDPITGDDFSIGDEIVFCASCKSAFLKESWEFMDGKHCNQKKVLQTFPVFTFLDLRKEGSFKIKKKLTISELMPLIICYLIVLGFLIYIFSGLYEYNNILFFVAVFGSSFLYLKLRSCLS